MASARDILVNLLGKETVSPAAKKAGAALDDLGDEMNEAARAAKNLDQQIDEINGSLRGLAQQYARTGDKEFIKQIRQQEAELRRLTKVRKLLGDSPDESKKAGLRIAGNLAEGITQGLSRVGGPVSAALSNVFGTLPPQAQAAIGGSIVAAVAAAAPAIGAAVSGAVLAGVGSGAVAVGVAAAFQDARLKGAAQDFGAELKVMFGEIGQDFAGDTIAALRSVRTAVRSLGLREAFAPAAGYIQPLTEGLTGLARNVMPGLKTAIAAAEKPIAAIAAGLPRLGTAVGSLLEMFARHAEAGATALTMLFDVIVAGVKVVEMQIDALATMFEVFDKLPNWLTGWAGVWIDASKDAGTATSDWNTKLDGLRYAVNTAGSTAAEATPQITTMAGAMKEAGFAADWLKQQMDILNGGFVNLHQAEAAYQGALDDFTASLKEHGATFTANTEAGRANIAAYSQLRDAAFANAQAQYESVAATGDLTGAQKSANIVLADAKRQFIAAGIAAGGNKDQVSALADEIFGTPKQWKTTFEAATATAIAKLTGLKKEIRTLSGKTITITTKFVTKGSRVVAELMPGGGRQVADRWGGMHVPMAAGGVMSAGIYRASNPPLVRFAEPATGGEAYIPRRGDRRRSTQILNEAAGWYGLNVGGGTQAASAPAPDWSRIGDAIGRRVARDLAEVFARASLRIDDRSAQFAGLLVRGG